MKVDAVEPTVAFVAACEAKSRAVLHILESKPAEIVKRLAKHLKAAAAAAAPDPSAASAPGDRSASPAPPDAADTSETLTNLRKGVALLVQVCQEAASSLKVLAEEAKHQHAVIAEVVEEARQSESNDEPPSSAAPPPQPAATAEPSADAIALRQAVEDWRADVTKLNAELDETKAHQIVTATALQSCQDEARATVARVEAEKQALLSDVDSARQQLERHTAESHLEKEQLDAAISQLRIDLNKAIDSHRVSEDLLADALKRETHLTDQLSECRGSLEEERANMREAATTLAAARSEVEVTSVKLRIAEQSRNNEFRAFERAVQSHQSDLSAWEAKYADALAKAELHRLEKEALKERLCDDHLREHVRTLKAENDSLREQMIHRNQEKCDELARNVELSAAIADKAAELITVRDYYESRLKGSQNEAQQLSKQLQDARLEGDRAKMEVEGRLAELQRGAFYANLTKTSEMVQLSPTTSPSRVSSHLRTTQGVQVDDHERDAAVRALRERNGLIESLQRAIDETEGRMQQLRVEYEGRLVSQMQDHDASMTIVANQLKVTQFKLHRVQTQCADMEKEKATWLEKDAAVSQIKQQLDDVLASMASRKQLHEKQLAQAAIETESLRARLRALHNENVRLRDDFELKLERLKTLSEAASPKWQLLAGGSPATTPKVDGAGGAATPGRDGSGSAALNVKLSKLKDLDDALLQIHSDSLALDKREETVRDRLQDSTSKLRNRLQHVKDSFRYWCHRDDREGGPNGEPLAQYLSGLREEERTLTSQLDTMEAEVVKFFHEIAEARKRLCAQSSSLLAERNAMHTE